MALASLGILPAAGKAERFNGYYKELLPVGNISILELSVMNVSLICESILLVTNQGKIGEHARVLGSRVMYAIQRGDNDMWSAIEESFIIPAERYYFVMPDCVTSSLSVLKLDEAFVIGTFETDQPGRFGVLQNGKIIDKKADLPIPATAWGVLSWTRKVVDYWKEQEISDYTQAFNMAIKIFGYADYSLDYYYDIATYGDYARFIKEHN